MKLKFNQNKGYIESLGKDMRSKPFVCWLGFNNDTALYIGDKVSFQPANSNDWLKGKVGCKRNGAYVVRVGSKEYPLYMRTQIRKL